MKKLTEKQIKFIEEYFIDFNATRSAISAGYSKKGARQSGFNLLTNPDIIHAIQKRKCQILKANDSTPEKVIERILNRATSNINDYYEEIETEYEGISEEGEPFRYTKKEVGLIPPTRLSREAGARIKSITVQKDGSLKYELYSAHSSDELLAKYHNLLTQVVDHKSTDGSMSPNKERTVVIIPSNSRMKGE